MIVRHEKSTTSLPIDLALMSKIPPCLLDPSGCCVRCRQSDKLEPSSRINVDFKPSKKMKKRRELDALVTNGKLPRRKSKSGHELLRSNDSDSSEVEEFSVPNGKQNGKKWIGFCPCSSCVALLVFVVMTTCLIACGGLIWMHFELKRDLDNLRERLIAVESRNQGAPEEFQKYHSQIQSINRTVQDMQTGPRGIGKITKNLTTISTQLSSLSLTTDGLMESLKAAPELKDLPTKFDTLTSSVASMGSDIQVAKKDLSTLTDFQKSAEQQLKDLTERVTTMESKPGSSLNSPDVQPGREKGSEGSNLSEAGTLQMLTELKEDIKKLNLSLVAKIEAVNSSLLTHETRLSLLENFTSHQQPSPAAPAATDSKTEAVNALKSLLLNGAPMGSSSSGDMAVLSALLGRVENNTITLTSLKKMYTQLQSNIASINSSRSSVQGEEHSSPPTDALISMEYLNSTVLRLTEDINHLFTTNTKYRNELNNVTAHIAGILRFLNAHFPSGNLSTPGKTLGNTSREAPATTTVKPTPAVVIKGINTMADLQMFFNRWDRQGDGRVDPGILPDFLGPAAPNKEQLKPFDADSDGKYTIKEFAAALGFKSQTDHTDTTEEDLEKIFA
ncbi:EF-hand calcium-binding domain-containing protein 14-like isoform X2 [Haliotis rubra]|uniref:EF-hand calcium-binding domain-containing protein 14-like isoform X2 n=1 Tax=Haliotis rubra TaxID=36100 RepID=UPI001EE53465|nr:EF-hand calcium-binding domain-containing protein 14-like isoform X2 [Haliotis rubra]